MLTPRCHFQTGIAVYPPSLDGVDGRTFPPPQSGSESLSPTPAFPVSPPTPSTPYGKEGAKPLARPHPPRGRPGAAPHPTFFPSDDGPPLPAAQPARAADGPRQRSVQSSSR